MYKRQTGSAVAVGTWFRKVYEKRDGNDVAIGLNDDVNIIFETNDQGVSDTTLDLSTAGIARGSDARQLYIWTRPGWNPGVLVADDENQEAFIGSQRDIGSLYKHIERISIETTGVGSRYTVEEVRIAFSASFADSTYDHIDIGGVRYTRSATSGVLNAAMLTGQDQIDVGAAEGWNATDTNEGHAYLLPKEGVDRLIYATYTPASASNKYVRTGSSSWPQLLSGPCLLYTSPSPRD